MKTVKEQLTDFICHAIDVAFHNLNEDYEFYTNVLQDKGYVPVICWEEGFDADECHPDGWGLCLSLRKPEPNITYPFKRDIPNPFEDDINLSPDDTKEQIEDAVDWLISLIETEE